MTTPPPLAPDGTALVIERLKDEAARVRQWPRTHRAITEAITHLTALSERCAALEEDGKRLDWLDENLGKVVPSGSSDARYWILGQKEYAPNKATNLRSAIDVARPSVAARGHKEGV